VLVLFLAIIGCGYAAVACIEETQCKA